MKTLIPIVIGSQSPRRQNLLNDLGIEFSVKTADIEESYPNHLKKEDIVQYLSKEKAKAIEVSNDEILITSDTIVWHDDRQLGKPHSAKNAVKMLQELSGNRHEVLTGVCFQYKGEQKVIYASTIVHFKELSNEEISFYIQKFHPFDKAGSYGIQEWIGMIGIDKIEGDYFNVMGLPINLVYHQLIEMGAIEI